MAGGTARDWGLVHASRGHPLTSPDVAQQVEDCAADFHCMASHPRTPPRCSIYVACLCDRSARFTAADGEVCSCRDRTRMAFCRQLQQSGASLRNPSPNVTVTDSFSFSHQLHCCCSCQAWRETSIVRTLSCEVCVGSTSAERFRVGHESAGRHGRDPCVARKGDSATAFRTGIGCRFTFFREHSSVSTRLRHTSLSTWLLETDFKNESRRGERGASRGEGHGTWRTAAGAGGRFSPLRNTTGGLPASFRWEGGGSSGRPAG